MVCRTFPIRVAGNSGPFWYDSNEISWNQLGVDPDAERTTVTRKIRRVATFSYDQLHEAAVLNMPTEIALTFADYLDPAIMAEGGKMPIGTLKNEFTDVWNLVDHIITITGTPVTMLGTGPKTVVELDYTEG
jgi:adenylosuccinate synthase